MQVISKKPPSAGIKVLTALMTHPLPKELLPPSLKGEMEKKVSHVSLSLSLSLSHPPFLVLSAFFLSFSLSFPHSLALSFCFLSSCLLSFPLSLSPRSTSLSFCICLSLSRFSDLLLLSLSIKAKKVK